MSLAEYMADYLKSEGIDSLGIKGIKRYSKSLLHDILVHCLVNGFSIKRGEFVGSHPVQEMGISLYYLSSSGEPLHYALEKDSTCSIDIKLPEFPKFLIDMNLWGYLTEEERTDLVRQLGLSISVIRRYYWDGNLRVVNPPQELFQLLSHMFKGFSFVLETEEGIHEGIVLDPYGEYEIDETTIREAQTFIIGGIVDKGKRFDRATEFLTRVSGYSHLKRYKIALRSSVIGVPDRINKILEILLLVRSSYSLEKAILETQNNSDKISRARFEINKGRDIGWLGINQKMLEKLSNSDKKSNKKEG
ncbi:tRNA (adenine(9)-N1)-methyltransferase Trm10 [Sulfuracidifex tepidarius]|nr:tRNA (adenine(9)-N1)-methyltransferase Trm10 [Sulfuracidifex tepidarius]